MGRGQGGCEKRIEVFVKIQKRKIWGRGGGVGGKKLGGGSGWGGGGGQGGCERRIEVFAKIKKKNCGGGGGGRRVGWGGGQSGCEPRIEVFVKIKKKNWGGGWDRRKDGKPKTMSLRFSFFFLGGGVQGGVGLGRGQGGYELRIEVFCENLKKKFGGGGGWGGSG